MNAPPSAAAITTAAAPAWSWPIDPVRYDRTSALSVCEQATLDAVHKTGTAFTKPVDPPLGQAIATWEAVRPTQPVLDRKTPSG